MGAPSYKESDEERALDYRLATVVLEDRFRPGNSRGGPARTPVRRGSSDAKIRKAKRAEAEALRTAAKTLAFVADMQAWYHVTKDVEPLRRR